LMPMLFSDGMHVDVHVSQCIVYIAMAVK